MRVAYMTGQYPRATDTFIQREVAALRDRGVEVHTFSVRRPGDEQIVGPEQKAERDNTFYILPVSPIALIVAHLNLLFSNPLSYLRALRLAWATRQPTLKGWLYQTFYFAEAGILAHQIRKRQVQHLHNHLGDSSCSVSMLASVMGGFTFSFTLHGPTIFFEPQRWRLDEKLQRSLFVSCISHFCRSQAMIFSQPDRWSRLHIVHCGIDPHLFEPVKHQGPGKRLLFTGRLAPVKGLRILLESLVALKTAFPNVELIVIGDGADREALENRVRQLGLQNHVKFVGYQSQREVRDYLQTTDVFVLPSFAEGVPVSLMEAMAAGVPVVTTRIAGVGELVEDWVNGYLVPPGDVTCLTDRIAVLLADGELRSKFGTAGRLKVEKEFNIQHEAGWLCQVMTSALAGTVEAIRPDDGKI
ncbi:MAG: glycosyltransferase family 4 protein [Leptolyngbyaceae cyanobacterium bins.59]|nr:glycosyltransferase family 4 protein [Leptolyngbyaceae cyanobacterium bins.59]